MSDERDDVAQYFGRVFRDTRSDMVWAVFQREGLLPEQVVTIKQRRKDEGDKDGQRKLKARWSMDLTQERFQEYLDHAEWLDEGTGA